MTDRNEKQGRARSAVTAGLLALMVMTGTGCASNGYYPGTYRTYNGTGFPGTSTTGGTSAPTSTADTTPPGYHYGDPHFCSPENGFCPLLIGAAIVGLAAALAH